jgi:hypothetical protein
MTDKQEQRSDGEQLGEPVAWAKRAEVWLHDLSNANFDWPYFTNGVFKGDCLELADLLKNLYTTPQQRTWVGLTEEERDEIYLAVELGANGEELIEAKLKEKNGG